jgi:O-antigen ligase
MSQRSPPRILERARPSSPPQVTARGREVPSSTARAAPPSSLSRAPIILARLMGAYIVVAVGRVSDLVPGLQQIPLAKVVVILAIIAAVRFREVLTSVAWKSVPPAKLTFLLMSIAAVSILFSVLRSATFGIITSTALAVVITLFLTIKAARGWAPVKTILHGAVFASVILVATVFTSKIMDSGGERAGYSSSYDPNDFAYVLIGFLPIVITFGIVSRGVKRLLYFGIVCVMTVAILLTQSRGGVIGLIFEIIAMTFILPVVWRGRLQFQTSKSKVIARVILLALIGAVGWHSLPENTRVRLGTITELGSDYNANAKDSGASAGRLAIWTRNLPLALNRPWGYGAGSFETVDGRFAGGRYRSPHNTFLQALIELGFAGFALFIAVIVSSLRYLHALTDTGLENPTPPEDEPRAFARALGIGLVGLCISGFFLSELYANVFWTLVSLSCAVGMVRRMQPGARGIAPSAKSTAR